MECCEEVLDENDAESSKESQNEKSSREGKAACPFLF